jgi:hypothetical protein
MALNNQLLNHFADKFGVVTVVNATFYAVDDDIPLISFDTLKMSNITSEGQQKEIRGGQGAELLLQYDFGRTANVEITDALVSMGSLEYLWGGSLSAGSFTALRRIEAPVTTANTWPTAISGLAVVSGSYFRYQLITPAGVKSAPSGGTLTGTTLPSLTAAVGSKVIAFLKVSYTAGTNGAEQMILSATDFPPTVRMVGETIVLDADAGAKVAFQIEIPKLKLDANFTFTLDAEGDPSVFDFSGVALSHNGQILIARTLGTI